MRKHGLHCQILLPLALTLAGACGASKGRVSASSGDAQHTGGKAEGNRGGVRTSVYRDPDNAFAVNVPDGWRVEREEKDGAYMTVIRPDQGRAANLSIMTIKAAPAKTDSDELRSLLLADSSKPFFGGWVDGLREQARVEGEGEIETTQVARSSALSLDVTYYRGDADDPRRGRSIYLVGEKTTFFLSLTASRSRFRELEEVVATLLIEP